MIEEVEPLRTEANGKPQIVSGLDKPTRVKPISEQKCAVRRQELMVILGNIGVLSTGMSLGLPTVTLQQLTNPNEAIHLSIEQASWYASINSLSSPLGGLLSSILLDKLGRKRSLYVVNVIHLLSWALMAFTIQTDKDSGYLQLIISRFISGIAMGMSSAPVGVYAAEIAAPKTRGRLILGTSISIATGITLIYLLGYLIRNDWQLLALVCSAYQLISLLLVIPMPESPSWLLAKGRITEAKKSLNYFRGLEKSANIQHPEVLSEFNLMQKNIELSAGQKKVSFVKSLRLPEVYKPLIILITLFAFQQLTGIFVVVVYAVQIATEAGVSIDPFICAVMIGVGRVITTCSMGVVLEKWGRRRCGMISAFGMCVCMLLLAAQTWVQWLHDLSYLSLVAIVSFIVISTLGLYTLPFFMISELFPQKVRGPASGVTVAFGTFFSFVCIKTYPGMKMAIGEEFCFVFYAVSSLLALLFIYLALPETRRRTLLEIEEGFRHKKQPVNPREVEMQIR